MKKQKHKRSRQEEAIELYRRGFSQNEIAEILGVNQSTVSRYFNNPTRAEVEDFYENFAYGSRVTTSGNRIVFNRRYRDIEGLQYLGEEIARTEYYYNDGTYWSDRFHHSINRKPVYDSTESWQKYIKEQRRR